MRVWLLGRKRSKARASVDMWSRKGGMAVRQRKRSCGVRTSIARALPAKTAQVSHRYILNCITHCGSTERGNSLVATRHCTRDSRFAHTPTAVTTPAPTNDRPATHATRYCKRSRPSTVRRRSSAADTAHAHQPDRRAADTNRANVNFHYNRCNDSK